MNTGLKSGRGVTLTPPLMIPRYCPNRPWGPPCLLYNEYRVKERPGRDADPSPLLLLWSRKSRVITIFSLWAVRPVQSLNACTRVHLYLYLYSDLILTTYSKDSNLNSRKIYYPFVRFHFRRVRKFAKKESDH